jgi:hypothetical protein
MTQGAELAFDGVGKIFGAVTALLPMTLSIAPGEFSRCWDHRVQASPHCLAQSPAL